MMPHDVILGVYFPLYAFGTACVGVYLLLRPNGSGADEYLVYEGDSCRLPMFTPTLCRLFDTR